MLHIDSEAREALPLVRRAMAEWRDRGLREPAILTAVMSELVPMLVGQLGPERAADLLQALAGALGDATARH